MPRQGSRKRPQMDDTTDAAPDEEGPTFNLHCHAALLTWNTMDEPSAADALAQLQAGPHWALVKHYTICAEKEAHWHVHAYLEFSKKVDHDVDGWRLRDVTPNVQPNKTTGSGYAQAVRRGSFYVANSFKKSFRSHAMNFVPAKDYSVKTQWVIDQWAQGKLRDPVGCAAVYMCLTPSFKAMVTMTQNVRALIDRTDWREERHRQLELQHPKQPFKTFPEVVAWKAQYDYTNYRYKFLWLAGPSRLGKSKLAESLITKPLIHTQHPVWTDYNPTIHTGIIFDDVHDIEKYIIVNKVMFQAASVAPVNTSATNCYTLHADTEAQMIIVTANYPPCEDWTMANCILLEILQPAWETPLQKRVDNQSAEVVSPTPLGALHEICSPPPT